jgi:Zn ribbon nucleic-acid-binding protein|tara:strand:- start:11 stop:514 length:504 start_codon:yes stop_codon:yes gene_type:complete
MQPIISNCPLCGEHSLHLSEDKELNFMQCVNCGYVSSDKFLGSKETNEEYSKLDELLQKWVKETENRLWIPIQMTLPFGMIYPALVDNEMKWIFADTQEIPEEERKNYPIEGQEGKFYDKKYNTENPKMYDIYAEALADVQKIIQEETQKAADNNTIDLKLPKLKKK